MNNFKIFSGTSNPELAQKICDHLGVPLGRINIKRFEDGEIFVKIIDNVRQSKVIIIQSTCPPNVNDYLIELFIMIHNLKYASARSITTVMPYYGYGRQDQKGDARTPITARLIADLIVASGAVSSISSDLHAGQIQGFFSIPNDNLFAMPIFIKKIASKFALNKKLTIVAPDAGGAKRARAYAKRLNAGLVLIDKRRQEANQSEVMNVIGNVRGRIAIIVDDMIDTGGTLVNGAEAIKKKGADKVFVCATHGLFSGEAHQKIKDSVIEGVFVTDTVPLQGENTKIEVLSISKLLAEAIKSNYYGLSVSSLFV